MSGDHPPAARALDHGIERLVFFTDAVFAIAITLLVIEIHVPHLPGNASDTQFLQALADLTPNFIGFLVSFLVIGAFWRGHHRAFLCAVRWDDRLMPASIFLLFAIAAMPFFTAFMSNYGNQRVPVVAYCCWLLLTALLSMRLQWLATTPPVVDESVSADAIRAIRRRSFAAILGALTAIGVGLSAPYPVLGLCALISITLWRLILNAVAARRKPGPEISA